HAARARGRERAAALTDGARRALLARLILDRGLDRPRQLAREDANEEAEPQVRDRASETAGQIDVGGLEVREVDGADVDARRARGRILRERDRYVDLHVGHVARGSVDLDAAVACDRDLDRDIRLRLE